MNIKNIAKNALLGLVATLALGSSCLAASKADQKLEVLLNQPEHQELLKELQQRIDDKPVGKEHLRFKPGKQHIKKKKDANKGLSYVTVGSFAICNYSTIQAAVSAVSSGETIRVTNETFSGNDALIDVNNKSLTFRGGYTHCGSSAVVSGKTTLDGTGMSFADSIVELIDTNGGMNINFYDFFISFGQNDGEGGGIEITGKGFAVSEQKLDLFLSNVDVLANLSDIGAGIHMTNADLVLANESNIASNSATVDGGGIYCRDGTIMVNGDSVIGDNGILFHLGNTADSDNDLNGSGGGVFLKRCDLTLDASDGLTGAYVIANSADQGGGILADDNSLVELKGDKAWVNLNQSSGFGGGMKLITNSVANLYNAQVKGNSSLNGGGIMTQSATLNFSQSSSYPCQGKCGELSENIASSSSAALYVNPGSAVTLDGIWIENNKSAGKTILISQLDGQLSIENSMITGNGNNPGDTGNLYHLFSIYTANYSMRNSTMSGNYLVDTTGTPNTIYDTQNSTLDLDSNIFWGNGSHYTDAIFNGGVLSTVTRVNYISDFESDNKPDPMFLVPGSNYHLQPNSPAIDYGTESLQLLYDIDGETRGLTNTPDAGADEANLRVGVAGNLCEYGSITEAIAAANDGDTIYISKGNYVENPGSISKSLTFVQSNNTCDAEQANALSEDLVIDGSHQMVNSGGLFNIATGKNVTFKNMTLQNARADYGGIIFAGLSSHLVLSNTKVTGGSAQEYGGGIRSIGEVTLKSGSEVFNNHATIQVRAVTGAAQRGAGVAITSTGSLTLQDSSRIYSNDAAADGGGIYSEGPVILLGAQSAISNNSAANGAGVYITGSGSLELNSAAEIDSNDSSSLGGGVYCSNASIIIQHQTEVVRNTAVSGGGIYGDSCTVSITGGHVGNVGVGNTASIAGGGLYLINNSTISFSPSAIISSNSAQFAAGMYLEISGSNKIVANGIIEKNTATREGGGVYLVANTDNLLATLDNLTVRNNHAQSGGGIAYQSNNSASFELSSSLLTGNTATQQGGGIYFFGGAAANQLTITGSQVIFGSSVEEGGGIAVTSPSTLETTATSISGNVSSANGGGIYLSSGAGLTASSTTIDGNIASSGDGGGVFIDSQSLSSTVLIKDQSKISNNQAINGGGVYALGGVSAAPVFTLQNSESYGNDVTSVGGSLYASNSLVNINHASIHDNSSSSFGAAFYVSSSIGSLLNSVLHDNISPSNVYRVFDSQLTVKESTVVNFTTPTAFLVHGSSQLDVENSIISGFTNAVDGIAANSASCNLDGTGTLGAIDSPLFVDAANYDYHLQATSPAINKCATGSVDDLDASPRPVGSGATPYDMGAFEYQVALASFDLNVTVVGSGSVTINPGNITCPNNSSCTESFVDGTAVTLVATPGIGFVLSGWSQDCSSQAGCAITMDQNHNVTATFAALSNNLLSVSVTGSGSVSSNPAGISCGADCSESYPENTQVTLAATPEGGFVLSGWSGACSGSGACVVDMSTDQNVSASFVLAPGVLFADGFE